jgi:hypothetical protein
MSKKPDNIRHADHPEYKEQVMSQLFGEFIGFLKAKGLTKGKEFDTQIQEVFQCSRKILWIDEFHPDLQITIYLNSIQMFAEFGVVKKESKQVIYRKKIEDLRYKISPDTELELIDGHQEIFKSFFKEFEEQFSKLEKATV